MFDWLFSSIPLSPLRVFGQPPSQTSHPWICFTFQRWSQPSPDLLIEYDQRQSKKDWPSHAEARTIKPFNLPISSMPPLKTGLPTVAIFMGLREIQRHGTLNCGLCTFFNASTTLHSTSDPDCWLSSSWSWRPRSTQITRKGKGPGDWN